jgi:hypothetical protein
MSNTKKLAKGVLVRLNPMMCFTTDSGGGRDRWNPLGNGREDENGIVSATRPTTAAEQSAWRAQNREAIKSAPTPEEAFAIGCDDAGESRLAPRTKSVTIHRDDILVVERARCAVTLGWGRPTGGLVKLMLPNGELAYLKRSLVEVI